MCYTSKIIIYLRTTMKQKLLFLLLLLSTSLYASDGGGVKKLNYQVGSSYSQLEYKYDSISGNDISLFTSINIPITKYIGASTGLTASKSKLSFTEDDSFKANGSDYTFSQSLFLRNSSLGKIGIDFKTTHSKTTMYDTSETSYFSTNSQYYSLYSSYYFHDFNLNTSYHYTDYDYFSSDHFRASIEYYFKQNTKFNFKLIGIENNTIYEVNLLHQPTFFDNSLEIGFLYRVSDYSHLYQLVLSHDFSTSVSLKERDREYR